ncbi:MAG: YihA family ribosome biogenesis GTP-binding protein, partial [Christensenellales bacterium]
LKNVFVLLDIRHEPTQDDLIMLDYLYKTSTPFTIIATKADKLSKQQIRKALVTISSTTGVGIDNVIVTSVQARIGKEQVESRIDQILSN